MKHLSSQPTIEEVHGLYRQNISVIDVVQEFFDRIKVQDEEIGAYVRVYEELALYRAQELQNLREMQVLDLLLERYPLFGIPYAIKDNFLVQGLPVTAQSKILEGYIAPYSSDVYQYLQNAGAILLGHTNMDELAMGSSTEYSGYGNITKNPHDLDRVPGGSSGGSAAAVSAGMAVFSMGTDTGGSVRQPASFCGIYGLRPTWGLLSRYGIVATSSSLDQPGIFAQTAQDTEKILEVLCRPSPNDDTNRLESYSSVEPKHKYRIGVPKEYFSGLSEETAIVFNNLKEKLSQTCDLVEVTLPSSHLNIAAYYLLMTVEAAANFEKYDGVRYGKPVEGDLFYAKRKEGFGAEATRRIMLGTYSSSAGYIDQYYNQAKAVRTQITQEFEDVLQNVDLILTPVSPFPAFKRGERLTANPAEMYLADIMTLSPALAGNASLSVPFASIQVGASQLPVGFQLIAPPAHEADIFAFLKTISF